MGSGLENVWDSIPREILVERARDIREHEGKVVGQGRWEGGRQSGERIVGGDSEAGDGTICEDENSSDGVDVLLDLSCNALPLEFVLPIIASVSQPRRIEDADLRKMLRVLTTCINVGTYQYAVVARQVVKASRLGLRPTIQTSVLVGVVEDFEVVVINILAGKDISDEFQG